MRIPLRKSMIMAACLVFLAGCTEQIEVENRDAEIQEIFEPQLLDENRLSIDYTILDAEGDDQELIVEICEEGGSACGIPFQGNGSDGVTFVPTAPAGSVQTHRYVWDVGCGRVAGEEILDTSSDVTYIARISPKSDPASVTESAPFILSQLGFGETLECPPR